MRRSMVLLAVHVLIACKGALVGKQPERQPTLEAPITVLLPDKVHVDKAGRSTIAALCDKVVVPKGETPP